METDRIMKGGQRAVSLDAFRGYAIITMILSGTVAFGILPGWMYHAQTPPPDHSFNPSNYGITWVDLVFPFFLFAMGAAFPFSIGRKIERGTPRYRLVGEALVRGGQLTFFAIFIQHMYPWIIKVPQDTKAWVTSISAFILMFPMFMRLPFRHKRWVGYLVKVVSFGLAYALLTNLSYANERQFSPAFSNIIILVLANMAIFGSIIYILTYGRPYWRLAILPFIMAVFLGYTTESSWVQQLYHYTPLSWVFHFAYLKYLFIVLPGSVAGEYLYDWIQTDKGTRVAVGPDKIRLWAMWILSILLITGNLYGLYTRELLCNLVVTGLLLFGMHYLINPNSQSSILIRRLYIAGAYLLLLGLFFEAYQGGIRKDDSTFSYYFVSSGLAFFALIAFYIVGDVFKWTGILRPFVMAGQNPMIAYVAPQLLIIPVLSLMHLMPWLDGLNTTVWGGFARGLILTALSLVLTMFFSRIKWFWRT